MADNMIDAFHDAFSREDAAICARLRRALRTHLGPGPSKIWHRHPAWFLDGNPIAGYSMLKGAADVLERPELYRSGPQAQRLVQGCRDPAPLCRRGRSCGNRGLVRDARGIQRDHANIYKTKGKLHRL